jgi:hypothetical protein
MTDGQELMAFFPHIDRKRWVMWTPDGYFAASEGGDALIGWHVNHGRDQAPDFFPASQFYDDFYRPEIFSSVIRGEKIEVKKDLRQGFATPPLVTILSPKAGETINTPTVEIVVQATDTGGGVQDIRLYLQGKLVGGGERGIGGVRESGKVVTQKFTVTLASGQNTLRATAYSTDNVEAKPFEVVVTSATAAKKPNLYLVAIGINKYKNPKYTLKFSRADAEGVVQLFSGQKGKIYEQVYPKTLFDEQATRANILGALKLETRPEDVVVIYLAGHGVSIDGKYYYLPYEITDAGDETVKKIGVTQDEIITALRELQARKVLLLLDTCQAGSLVVAMRGVDEERAVKLLSKTAGVHVLTASKGDQAAAELAKLGHGLFTYAILQGLGGKADANKDRSVRVSELLVYVCSDVEAAAAALGKEQYPTMSMHGDDFPVAVY